MFCSALALAALAVALTISPSEVEAARVDCDTSFAKPLLAGGRPCL